MEKQYKKNNKVLGIIYAVLIIPAIILMSGSAFIFDDSKTTESVVANIFFWLILTLPFTLIISACICFWNEKVSVYIDKLYVNFIVYLPVLQILGLIVTIGVITQFCNGEFCI